MSPQVGPIYMKAESGRKGTKLRIQRLIDSLYKVITKDGEQAIARYKEIFEIDRIAHAKLLQQKLPTLQKR